VTPCYRTGTALSWPGPTIAGHTSTTDSVALARAVEYLKDTHAVRRASPAARTGWVHPVTDARTPSPYESIRRPEAQAQTPPTGPQARRQQHLPAALGRRYGPAAFGSAAVPAPLSGAPDKRADDRADKRFDTLIPDPA